MSSSNFQAEAALSMLSDTSHAMSEVVDGILERLGGNPDIATLFFTPHHAHQANLLRDELQYRLGAEVSIGCSASGVVAGAVEIEDGPGLSLWAARIPGARAQSFHLSFEEEGDTGMVRGWPDVGEEASIVLLADPFSFPLSPFLDSLRQMKHMPPIVGGVACGGNHPGSNRFIVEDRIVETGAVGFVLDGAATIEPLVSQGCRPLGKPFIVTRSKNNVIFELNELPAYQGLDSMVNDLDEEDSKRFRQAPQVGLRKVDSTGDLGSDGFVIRGVVGVDKQTGAVAVSDQVRDGMELQFHARDHQTAHQDLGDTLGLASSLYPGSAGALLFTCTGRGQGLFGRTNHDAGLANTYFPETAVAGMFAAGEIGSVCGMPYIHGFSVSMGLLVEREG